MEIKNIAIVCNYVLHPNRIGGMDRFFKLFDATLKKQGYHVDWFFTQYTPFDFYKDLTIYNSHSTSVEKKFLEVVLEESKSYDVIITHFTELCTPFYKKVAQFFPKAKVIAVDHNPRPLEGFPLKKRIKKRIQGFLYGTYIHQFIGVSKYTAHHILKDYGAFLKHKTQVVYNGIDVDVFLKRTQENAKKFIVASHLRKSKGIQDLLMALSKLDRKLLENVQIDIYGEGPYKQQLKALRKQFQLENVVDFKGSSSKLNELFREYAYMIQPTYMECFSLSILESLSANIPVITTTVGGNLEVVEDGENGFIYQPGDVQKLSNILHQIITNQKRIEKDTSALIQKEFPLTKMVLEHVEVITT